MTVAYGAPTVADGTPPVSLICSPPSDSTFPVGETPVTCTAIDAEQRSSSCTLLITVKMPPELALTRFVAFGDSITWGEDGTNPESLSFPPFGWRYPVQLPISQTYPGVLRQELTARYPLQTFAVDNAGCPGEAIGSRDTVQRFLDVLNGLGGCRYSGGGGQYQAVLLMEGSNDVNERDDRIWDAAIDSLRKILDHAKSQGIQSYLATLPPETDGFRAWAPNLIEPFNERIRALANERGVPLVDVYQALNSDAKAFIGFDGLHPNAAGYAKMADTFLAAITKTLETRSPATSRAR